jgi:type IV pilus assembly protein PilP
MTIGKHHSSRPSNSTSLLDVGRATAAVLTIVSLTACSTAEHSDLQAYVDDVISQQKPNIEPLPEFRPYPIFVYESGDLRDPFKESAFVADRAAAAFLGSGIKPPEEHTREPLEDYPLDTLRMVGTLEQTTTMWALVKDGEGAIHRVKTGNYLGKNYGKILAITEHQVDILEIVPHGLGAYIERPASIALSE